MPKSVKEAAEEYADYQLKHCDTEGDPFREECISDFLAGAEWMRQQFTLHGTDGCRDCETGRATMYVTLGGRCLECDNKYLSGTHQEAK